MHPQHKEQRVGIFIDIQNLYHSSKNLYSARVNYKELIKHLVAERKLIRAVGYVVKTDTSFGEESFFDALKQAGIELRIKDIQINPDGTKKADWDVGMAVDAIRMASFLDTIILVTGDGDFIPLVDYLRWGMGREVEVAAFSRTTSGKLKEVVDLYTPLEDLPRILLKKRATRTTTRNRTTKK
jgi:uncharacterized LabA/DUF88 family protein